MTFETVVWIAIYVAVGLATLVLTLTLAKFFRFIVSAQGAVFVILLLMLGVTGYVVVNYAL